MIFRGRRDGRSLPATSLFYFSGSECSGQDSSGFGRGLAFFLAMAYSAISSLSLNVALLIVAHFKIGRLNNFRVPNGAAGPLRRILLLGRQRRKGQMRILTCGGDYGFTRQER